MDGRILGHQIRFAPGAHLLGEVGILHVHEVVLVKAAHSLEHRSVHGREAAGAELDLGGFCQVFVRHEIALVVLCPEFQAGQLAVHHGPHTAPAQRQTLGPPVREGERGPRHHHAGVLCHPVRKVTQRIRSELDIRVQDKVHPALQQAEHRVVAGAKAAVLCAAEHLHLLVLADVQGAVLRGLCKALAAAVRAGVVHQIQCQRVAAGAVQHGLCRPERFIRAVINYDTSRKFHVVHSSGLMSKLKSSFIRSKLGFMQGSPTASCFAHRFWKRSTSETKRLRLTGFSSRPRLLLS